jgi:hypothetical protein
MRSAPFATKNEVTGALRISRLNMKEFALFNGYQPDTVGKVASRYAGTKKKPRGVLAGQILQKPDETTTLGK